MPNSTSSVVTRSQKNKTLNNQDTDKNNSYKSNTSYISIDCSDQKEENTENEVLQELRNKLATVSFQLQELQEQTLRQERTVEYYRTKCANQQDTITNLQQVISATIHASTQVANVPVTERETQTHVDKPSKLGAETLLTDEIFQSQQKETSVKRTSQSSRKVQTRSDASKKIFILGDSHVRNSERPKAVGRCKLGLMLPKKSLYWAIVMFVIPHRH
ncbi:hypothetical protein QE152_g37726 [Popillia japonica]|uniref:Uncharacterized protein n=1 Tax=Popillia japonica TaxID=7064 RepID=A0AAW1I997_POPJA